MAISARGGPDHAWHALPAEDVCRVLGSSVRGLGDAEAGERLREHGPNVLRPAPPRPAWRVLLGQFASVVVWLLGAATVVSFIQGGPLETLAILVVLAINVVIGFVTELRAHRAVEALSRLDVPAAAVVRDGVVRTMAASDLVPGDVIALEAGSAVPADARLLESTELRMVEAPLTGESLPVSKHPRDALAADTALAERSTMVYKATTVAAGLGRAVVVATGMQTEVGRIGALVSGIRPERTILQRRLDALGRMLVVAALAIGGVIGALELARGRSWGDVLQTALAVAIAAVPEGLPAVVTITMALGTHRMARRRALVRRLTSVETLGSATIVCTDKTGTLTSGEQTATTFVVAGGEIHVEGVGFVPVGAFELEGSPVDPAAVPGLALALRIAAIANDASLEEREGRWTSRGDPTDIALLVAARKAGVDGVATRAAVLPFSSDRMLMAGFVNENGALRAYAKGAPARILERCTSILEEHAERPLDDQTRAAVGRTVEALGVRGLRVIGLATGTVRDPAESQLQALTFVGLAALVDPPAEGVRDAVTALRDAGIRTKMLTGDHASTAVAIAQDVGLATGEVHASDASRLDRASDEELERQLDTTDVWSRVTAESKLRIISAFQQRGEIVAMLGDGVNDAAALRKADIGVAMGIRGTDVAKEAAGLVLADDRFPTIVAAVEEGRVVFDNIRKFVFYLFSCNLAEILSLLGAGLLGMPLPVTPLQILWLNVITDTTPALALAAEPAEQDVMRRPPHDPRAPILSRQLLWSTVVFAVLIAAATLGALTYGLRGGGDVRRAVTLSFTTLAIAQLLHLGNARSRRAVLGPRAALANRYAIIAVLVTIALQAVALHVPAIATALGATPLTLGEWAVAVGFGSVPAVLGQAGKLASSARKRRSVASRGT